MKISELGTWNGAVPDTTRPAPPTDNAASPRPGYPLGSALIILSTPLLVLEAFIFVSPQLTVPMYLWASALTLLLTLGHLSLLLKGGTGVPWALFNVSVLLPPFLLPFVNDPLITFYGFINVVDSQLIADLGGLRSATILVSVVPACVFLLLRSFRFRMVRVRGTLINYDFHSQNESQRHVGITPDFEEHSWEPRVGLTPRMNSFRKGHAFLGYVGLALALIALVGYWFAAIAVSQFSYFQLPGIFSGLVAAPITFVAGSLLLLASPVWDERKGQGRGDPINHGL